MARDVCQGLREAAAARPFVVNSQHMTPQIEMLKNLDRCDPYFFPTSFALATAATMKKQTSLRLYGTAAFYPSPLLKLFRTLRALSHSVSFNEPHPY